MLIAMGKTKPPELFLSKPKLFGNFMPCMNFGTRFFSVISICFVKPLPYTRKNHYVPYANGLIPTNLSSYKAQKKPSCCHYSMFGPFKLIFLLIR